MPKSTSKPTPPRRLARTVTRAPVDDLDGFLTETPFEQAQDVPTSARVSTILAMTVIEDTLRPVNLKRIAQNAGLAVVVAVPGPEWVEPIAQALSRAGEWGEVVKRTGASRMQDKPDVGRELVGETLATGLNAVGVSNAPDRYLPENLAGLADSIVQI
jgi:cell division protease FtsH